MSPGHTPVTAQVSGTLASEIAGDAGDGTAVCRHALIAEACTLGEVLDDVGGKWSTRILLAAIAGPVRFSELDRLIPGISRRMLTLTLRQLERDGLLRRTVYPVVPPKVEYTATAMALELRESLAGLTGWADRHRVAIAAARASYDQDHPPLR